MKVGAGTVLDAAQMRQVQRAGASFAVSPGSSPQLLAAAREESMAYLPGVATGSEVMAAMAAGFDLLKLFPAQAINALGLLAAWRGPFAQVRFCPTGGIDAARAPEYLRQPNVACLGGSWLTPADALAQGDWERIETLAREAAALSIV
jgi:2-dehydro-3-deoxyphosphogluconate aldolase/(4S)-4-hydroxy-2-oxoglutarate aldolase